MKLNGNGSKIKGKIGNKITIVDNDIRKGCIRPIINMPTNLLDNEIII